MTALSATPAWNEDLIVVTGFARTGTTLMQGLLCASPDVMPVSAEPVMLRDLVITYVRAKKFWLDYSRHYFADKAALRDYFRETAAQWMAHLRARFGAEGRLLQKLPQAGAQYLTDLLELLPNARFVVMLRDPRDVLASQAEWLGRAGLRFEPGEQIRAFLEIYARMVAAKSLAGRLALVPYERLVREPEPVMQAVARFLGIRLPSDIAGRGWDTVRSQQEATWSPLDGRPVTAERVARHRAAASLPGIAEIEGRRAEIERRIGMPVFVEADVPPAPVRLI